MSIDCLLSVQLKGLEGEITRRSLTHSSWDLTSSRDPHRKGWHPVTYKLADATSRLVQSIKVVFLLFWIYSHFTSYTFPFPRVLRLHLPSLVPQINFHLKVKKLKPYLQLTLIGSNS